MSTDTRADKHATLEERILALIAEWRENADNNPVNLIKHIATGLSVEEPRWLFGFDEDDRREMARDLATACREAMASGDEAGLEARIHEWIESGWASISPVLAEAKADVGDNEWFQNWLREAQRWQANFDSMVGKYDAGDKEAKGNVDGQH